MFFFFFAFPNLKNNLYAGKENHFKGVMSCFVFGVMNVQDISPAPSELSLATL